MKEYIKMLFPVLFIVFTILFVWLKLIDLAYLDENNKIILVAAIGLIGAILSGIISGGLTLLGVKLTIDNQEKKEVQGKIDSAKYLFTETLTHLTEVNNNIKSITAFNFDEYLLKIKESALRLNMKSKEHHAAAIQISLDFYRNFKSIEYHSKEILHIIDSMIPGDPDQKTKDELMIVRNNLAKCDQKFEELIRHIDKR